MDRTDVDQDLHVLIDCKGDLEDLMQDLDRTYRPAIVRLTALSLPGTDELGVKLQTATRAIEDLYAIVSGVAYAGEDEGAFLYWEYEAKPGRTEAEAVAAIRLAFSGQEQTDCLLLYREYRAKLPAVPDPHRPVLRIEMRDDAQEQS